MKTQDFDYDLPLERIAQEPLAQRDTSRLMVLGRDDGRIAHHTFRDIETFLRPGDVLVVNNSRVMPARLFGHKQHTGGKVELLLLDEGVGGWQALAGGKRLREGAAIVVCDAAGAPTDIVATITAVGEGALRTVQFSRDIRPELAQLGHMPLPPYIHTRLEDDERYQTVYARPVGSAAAPTAGLHFTGDLLFALREKGVLFETCTLHVGLDTFKPVSAELVAKHHIHSEWATLSPEAAQRINEAKLAGGRIIAVGTTAVRTLETAALRAAGGTGSLQHASSLALDSCPWKPVAAFSGATDLYIYPGYQFRAVDAMITNFHLPKSSLLMLVSAFASVDSIRHAYEVAINEKYRFFSFGDAMFIQ